MDTNVENVKKKHPKGLYLVSLTGMWERFSYYGIRGISMLYLTKTFLGGGLTFGPQTTNLIYGFATGLTYFTSPIGGQIIGNFLEQREAVLLGGLIIFFGEFVLSAMHSHIGLYLGPFLLVTDNGFFEPNISASVEDLYEPGDKCLDSAFSIFYMGVSLGAFLTPLPTGLLTDNVFTSNVTNPETGEVVMPFGYRYGLLAAVIGMLVSEVVFLLFTQKYLDDLGLYPKGGRKKMAGAEVSDIPLTKEEKERIAVTFVYFFFAVFFFAGFEQAGSSSTLCTDKFVNHVVGSFEIPTAWFQSVNPLFVVVLASVLASFWNSKFGQALTTPFKMGTGLIFLSIGYFFMLGAVYERGGSIGNDPSSMAVKADLAQLILAYLAHITGELCLSPAGLSVVTGLSPPKLVGLLMRAWMAAAFFVNAVGGVIVSYVEKLGPSIVFTVISGFVILYELGVVLLNKRLQRMVHGVK